MNKQASTRVGHVDETTCMSVVVIENGAETVICNCTHPHPTIRHEHATTIAQALNSLYQETNKVAFASVNNQCDKPPEKDCEQIVNELVATYPQDIIGIDMLLESFRASRQYYYDLKDFDPDLESSGYSYCSGLYINEIESSLHLEINNRWWRSNNLSKLERILMHELAIKEGFLDNEIFDVALKLFRSTRKAAAANDDSWIELSNELYMFVDYISPEKTANLANWALNASQEEIDIANLLITTKTVGHHAAVRELHLHDPQGLLINCPIDSAVGKDCCELIHAAIGLESLCVDEREPVDWDSIKHQMMVWMYG